MAASVARCRQTLFGGFFPPHIAPGQREMGSRRKAGSHGGGRETATENFPGKSTESSRQSAQADADGPPRARGGRRQVLARNRGRRTSGRCRRSWRGATALNSLNSCLNYSWTRRTRACFRSRSSAAQGVVGIGRRTPAGAVALPHRGICGPFTEIVGGSFIQTRKAALEETPRGDRPLRIRVALRFFYHFIFFAPVAKDPGELVRSCAVIPASVPAVQRGPPLSPRHQRRGTSSSQH